MVDTIERIKRHEGFRAIPYPDPLTHGEPFTFGYGFTYLTREEASEVLFLRLEVIQDALISKVKGFAIMPKAVIDVLIEMAFQLGVHGLLGFDEMFIALRKRNYKKAAAEIRNSLLYRQTPTRGEFYASVIESMG